MSQNQKHPVALFCFNRAEPTKLVFEAIRKYQPSVLFLIQDGPRAGNAQDAILVQQVRSVLDVTWPCKVLTIFREQNVGLLESFNAGLNYIFSHAETCIILEDDCLPDQTFFSFMDYGLREFKSDKTVGMIHGYSDDCDLKEPFECYPSRLPKVWGWATWSDRHAGFDARNILGVNSKKIMPSDLTRQGFSRFASISWARNLNRATKVNTWDYQWCFHVLSKFGCSIAPSDNLIENIGFGPEATHTRIIPPYIQFRTRGASPPSNFVVRRNLWGWRDKRETMRRIFSLASLHGLKAIQRKLFA